MMRLIFLSTVFIVFSLSSATAQSTGEGCAKIQADNQRLECYDLIFKQERVGGPTQGVGAWRVTEDVSLIDDSRTVFLRLTSEDSHPGRFGGREKSYLAIACRENTTSLWMTFADNFMSSNAGSGSVTYRIDDEEARSQGFRESNDNSALGLWNGSTAIPFVKRLIGNERLVVRATPFSESSVTATYDIRGLENAIVPLRQACNW